MVASRCVGAAQRLVDEVTAFAGDRIVDGKPLGEHQLVAGMLADSATRTVRRPQPALRGGPRYRRRPGPQGAARPGVDGQAKTARKWPGGWLTGVQIFGERGWACARTSPNGCTGNCGWNGSGRASGSSASSSGAS